MKTIEELLALPFDEQEGGLKLWSSILVVPTDEEFEIPAFQYFCLVGCDNNGKPISKLAYCDVVDIQRGVPAIDMFTNGIVRIHAMGRLPMRVYNNSAATIEICEHLG